LDRAYGLSLRDLPGSVGDGNTVYSVPFSRWSFQGLFGGRIFEGESDDPDSNNLIVDSPSSSPPARWPGQKKGRLKIQAIGARAVA